VKRKGTSQFVAELVTNWLKEIRDPDTLDDFEKMIKERRAMLMIETENERSDKLVEDLKQCKFGDTLYLMKPLPMISEKRNSAAKFAKYARDENRMECKFWKWHPRKKMLWVYVPWKTTRKHYDKNFVLLTVSDITRLQPSRTERDIRLKAQQRR